MMVYRVFRDDYDNAGMDDQPAPGDYDREASSRGCVFNPDMPVPAEEQTDADVVSMQAACDRWAVGGYV